MPKPLLFLLLVLWMVNHRSSEVRAQPGPGKQPVKIIYDTDMDLDVDDAGALAVLHALADKGEAEILGVIANAPTPYSATTVAAINRYYGRPTIPIGDMPLEEYIYDPSFNTYYRSYAVGTPYGNFNIPIFRRFDHGVKSRNDIWNGVALYRKLLAEAPDKSVTIAAVGLLTVLEDLLQSKPDKYSKLTGKELIKRKVKELVCMTGGNAPAPNRASFNWGFEGRGDAERITRQWPTPIYLSPMGGKVGTGARLKTETPEINPVRVAYELFLKPAKHKNRPSWDQIAVYYAVRGKEQIFEELPGRRLDVTAEKVNNGWRDGKYEWREARPGEPLHIKISQKIPDETLGEIIEDLMVQLPKNNKSSELVSFKPAATLSESAGSAHQVTVSLNEEPLKSEDVLVLGVRETVKWNAPGGKKPEIVIIKPEQDFSVEFEKIIRADKPSLVLVHDHHQKAFRQLKQTSSPATEPLVFVLTRQEKAPWFSVNVLLKK